MGKPRKYTLTDIKKGRDLTCVHKVPIWEDCDACSAEYGSVKEAREKKFWAVMNHYLFGSITTPAFDELMSRMKKRSE